MKKHILFIVENNSFPADVRVRNEAFAALKFGFDVSVICPVSKKADKKFELINGIDIYRHPMPIEAYNRWGFVAEYANAIFWETVLSIRVFIKKRFHVIHAANPPDHIFLIALLFKIFGVKFIFDHHDIAPENYLAKFERQDFFYKLLTVMEKMTFKTADLIISTNESYKNIAIVRGNKKSEEVFVVRNGPDLDKLKIVESDENLREGFKYLVGYVGVIAQQEGIDNLLKVVDYIIKTLKITNVKFVIIGKGPHWKYIVQLSKDLNLNKYVYFTGFIPDEELYRILSTVDVCVNPEFKNEFTDKSTMIKIMEYMTFGKPVVQFHTVEGEVTAGDASVYVQDNSAKSFANALIELLEDPEKRKYMGSLGRARVEKLLSWQIQKEKLEIAYRKIFTE